MRFQQGVDDRPTRSPISATESEASSWSTVQDLAVDGVEAAASLGELQRSVGHVIDLSVMKSWTRCRASAVGPEQEDLVEIVLRVVRAACP